MTEGKVYLLLPNFKPQLMSVSRPWTFKRAHVNNFSKLWDVGSWEDYDWPEWTSKVGTTQVTPARFMLERNMDPSSNNGQYLMMNKEDEGDDEMISCWGGDDGTGSLTGPKGTQWGQWSVWHDRNYACVGTSEDGRLVEERQRKEW